MRVNRGGTTRIWLKIMILLTLIIGGLAIALLNGCHQTLAPTGEVEATEFQGKKLTPINQQLNNALIGTQDIDRTTYRLTVDGLVDNPLSLSYADLQAYPQESRLTDLNCVEGWNFTAKWTGPQLNAIFNAAKLKPEAKIAIFRTADAPYGYCNLDLSYLHDNNIIIALKLNDITLPPDRGFPFQVVSESKWGYKWVKCHALKIVFPPPRQREEGK